ncbi:hypothetical protein [Streptomyces aureocirculatus]|uniref:hypothetical protein n=1 Tax=Streptomyces aureocirculatus TaxID=67275 RepID=UPI000ADD3D05|nr:hypothetical protein [Streptomyces aureocirculatus]
MNWRRRGPGLPNRYKYSVGMIKTDQTTSDLGYVVDTNMSESKWTAHCYTDDNSQ